MKRPAYEHDDSLEDTQDDSEGGPGWKHAPIKRFQRCTITPKDCSWTFPDGHFMAGLGNTTPPLQHYDLYTPPTVPVYGMDAGIHKNIFYLRENLPLSPEMSRSSTPCSEELPPLVHSDLDPPPQSHDADSDEDSLPESLPESLPDYTEDISRPITPQSFDSGSTRRFASSDHSLFTSFAEPHFSSVFANKLTFTPDVSIWLKKTSSEIELKDALVGAEQQSLALEHSFLSDLPERARDRILSYCTPGTPACRSLESSSDNETEQDSSTSEAAYQGACSSHVNHYPVLPHPDIKKSSKSQTKHPAMEIDPYGFGMSNSNIASLPECVRARIMSFCTEPRDLMALIKSSPVFLQPFRLNRHAIVSQVTNSMRFRFGGDMPHSCLMAARLRNMDSKSADVRPEALKVRARRIITTALKLSHRGALLHPLYSLRLLMFISDTLDKTESLMTRYAHQASTNKLGVKKLGHSYISEGLALSQTERKRFMDAICLYDAYCTAFFSENAVSSHDDTALRQSFFEDDGVPDEIIKRFYSITLYLKNLYLDWLSVALMKKHHDHPVNGENPSLLAPSVKHIDPLINHFICSGPSVLRMLQDQRAPVRYDFLLRLLDRCETDAEYLRSITAVRGKGVKRSWAYSEMAGLTQQEVLTAQHFWDPGLVESMKATCHRRPTIETQVRRILDA
ncbi:uncharacterized protein BKA55DRAFT_609803 [Fusarium redolens]|uniref:Uncharacterized protein n=1 Tax=Fusarium redolens TaxID=48865 RepID=A0A9P9HK01_FUSRE|nr:uncharacterized protein BKA55DRAFT_609803 [Fusarium redolens]KAH7259009.1 hypothetical protein BKA55DRAFT_609803 [Fusarium redolens]